MSEMRGRAPPGTEEHQDEQRTYDTNARPRLSIGEATFILDILRQTRESASKKVNWDRAAAATGLQGAAAARGKYGEIHTRMGWDIPQDAQFEQPTDKRIPTAKAANKATIKKEPEDNETDDSDGGVKLNIKKRPEDDSTENSDGGVRLDIQKDTERPAGEDWLLTKPFQLPTRHPASRGPASGRPSLR